MKQKRHTTTAPGLRIRRVVQAGFFLLVALIAIGHTLEEQGITIPLVGGASLHAVCPFGGVVSIYEYITAGSFVRKTHESSWALMWIGFATAILFGPAFCGWICPLGTVQEWVGRLGRRVFGKRYNTVVPRKVDRVLRYLRYLVLAWVVYVTAVTGTLIFADVDPYFALFNFWTGEVAPAAFVVLGLTLLGALFVERPFCKYGCPYGAVLGLFNLVRLFGIKRNAGTCISCGLCDRVCPMNITVSTAGTIRDHQCISCLECTSEAICPVPATVTFHSGKVEAS